MKTHAKVDLMHAVNPGIHAFSVKVAKTPVEYLYWRGYQLHHVRTHWLDETELSALLESRPNEVIAYASLGREYRWYDRGDYRFWQHVARGSIVKPNEFLDDLNHPLPGYWASIWCAADTEDNVILLEQTTAEGTGGKRD